MFKFLFSCCCKSFSLWEFLILGCSVYLFPIRMYCVVSPFWLKEAVFEKRNAVFGAFDRGF